MSASACFAKYDHDTPNCQFRDWLCKRWCQVDNKKPGFCNKPHHFALHDPKSHGKVVPMTTSNKWQPSDVQSKESKEVSSVHKDNKKSQNSGKPENKKGPILDPPISFSTQNFSASLHSEPNISHTEEVEKMMKTNQLPNVPGDAHMNSLTVAKPKSTSFSEEESRGTSPLLMHHTYTPKFNMNP